jgi:rod shape-determining protein MreD
MRARHVAGVIFVVLVTAAIQTTLFAQLRPFDAVPALVLLIVIGYARLLRPEFALFLGFSAGLMHDLLSESPLGLWALVLTTVAYSVLNFRDRFEEDFGSVGPLVFVFTVGGLILFVVLGTVFGEKTLADAGLVKKIILPSIYNVALTPLIFPVTAWTVGLSRKRAGAEYSELSL